jgi:peptidyl-prolyl cis-trans isomerase B (cyclophilin B)
MRKRFKALKFLLTLSLLSCLAIFGCSSPVSSDPNPSIPPPPTTAMNTTGLPRLEGKATVEMQINGGRVLIELDGNDAPITSGNFLDLVERGFYNGLSFHRVVKEPQPFVVQGGDPLGNGTGGFKDPKTGKPRNIPLEIKLEKQDSIYYSKPLGQQAGFAVPPVVLHHSRGALAMARSQSPDSASSQFYFALSDLAFLDGDYAVFGYVTQGMDVVDNIKQGDKIESAKIISGKENLKR